jgi:signal transduction histidine kinase
MRILRAVLHAVMALALAAGWAFLYWQSGALDIATVEQARAALAELRALDARWNDQLVGGATEASAARPRTLYARFEARALALGNPALAGTLAPLRQALEEKALLVERYREARAALAQARASAAETARLAELRAAADALFAQAWLAATGPRLELAGRALDRAFDDALTQVELHRAWLLYYSGMLLAVLAFALWNVVGSRRALDRANAALREANESLEERVRSRTRELAEALERLKASEAMLVHSEKMSSLGQMVAGLVHELNTPLAYVKAAMEAVARRTPELERLAAETDALLGLLAAEGGDERVLAERFAAVRAQLDALRASRALEDLGRQAADGLFGIGRIGELVASLKSFSRLDRSAVAEVDLHEGLESTLRIARHQLGRREVVKDFGRIARVTCAPSQINQVFLNLLTNAVQATPEQGGRIVLRTSMPDAAHVAVEVADNGCGIAPEALPKIFDPFFTTKPVGEGTGLGLAISYRIVQSHGGRLTVESKPGAGTRFTVLLPVAPPAAA